jgi:hypothetical protein
MRSTMPIIATLAFLLAATAVAVPANAQTTTVTLDYTWDAPTTGSAVDHYVVEQSVNGGPFVQIATSPTNTYSLEATVGDTHSIRVAGVDDQSRQGPYSDPSDPYTVDLGPPGQPGQPILF